MAWSTREIAELAGTTVKAVRHYHEVGLLEQPERAPNGYKQYGVTHLLRVLQIKRLGDLGVPLAQVATMSYPYEGLQELAAEVPTLVQPIIIAAAAMVAYIEGAGAAAFGVIAGVHPVVAGLAAAFGNIVCVVLVVLLSSRVRASVVAATNRRVDTNGSVVLTDSHDPVEPDERKSKGQLRLERWSVRFGVPGASLLAPLALPTVLTAAAFVASGIRLEWVILWQVVAVVVWTAAVTATTTGAVSVLSS